MSEFKVGDRIIFADREYLVIHHEGIYENECIKISKIPVGSNDSVLVTDIFACDFYQVKRLPRIGEQIQVRDDEQHKWLTKYFVCFDDEGYAKVSGINVLTEDAIVERWIYWRFPETELSKEYKIELILKKIENNDKDILKELAEIILAMRENKK